MPASKSIMLPNNCRCSEPSVIPKNWKTASASIKTPWTICYRFYDPSYPKPKQVQIRQMNIYKDLKGRQAFTKQLIDQELSDLKSGFNPITKVFPVKPVVAINMDTPVFAALTSILESKKIDHGTKASIESSLKYMEVAAVSLRLSNIPVSEIKRRHIKMILNQAQENRKLSSSSFNHYRAYLSLLFDELVESEAVEFNPVTGVSKQAIPRKIKVTLSADERKKIDKHFKENNYPFWRYMHIFFHSGCRTKELFKLKRKDVSFENQSFLITVKKGKQSREVRKVIKDVVFDLWRELCSDADPEAFVFSTGFKPGNKLFSHDRPTKIWAKEVKEEMGIAADFYSLKHLHTTEVADLISQAAAAKHNSHTSTAMVRSIYDVNSAARELEQLKKLNNKF